MEVIVIATEIGMATALAIARAEGDGFDARTTAARLSIPIKTVKAALADIDLMDRARYLLGDDYAALERDRDRYLADLVYAGEIADLQSPIDYVRLQTRQGVAARLERKAAARSGGGIEVILSADFLGEPTTADAPTEAISGPIQHDFQHDDGSDQ